MQTLQEATRISKFIVRYAHFQGLDGYAILTPTREALFTDHDGNFIPLTNADIPHLTMLGLVDLVERQNVLDALAGGAAWICTHREMEVA